MTWNPGAAGLPSFIRTSLSLPSPCERTSPSGTFATESAGAARVERAARWAGADEVAG